MKNQKFVSKLIDTQSKDVARVLPRVEAALKREFKSDVYIDFNPRNDWADITVGIGPDTSEGEARNKIKKAISGLRGVNVGGYRFKDNEVTFAVDTVG